MQNSIRKTKKFLSLLFSFCMLGTTFSLAVAPVAALTDERTVNKEIVIYEWDLTDYHTFWSVAGEGANPLDKASGSNDACDFSIGPEGSYIMPKTWYTSFSTMGGGKDLDLSDPTTKLVVEYETSSVPTQVIIKAAISKGPMDVTQASEIYYQERCGAYRFEKNISSDTNDFVGLQFMTNLGREGAAVTFQKAKVVKTVSGPRAEADGAVTQTVKRFSMASDTDIEDISYPHVDPAFTEAGMEMTASDAAWVGFSTKYTSMDLTDPSVKLVVDIDNPSACTVAYKYVAPHLESDSQNGRSGEMLLSAASGLVEIHLDQYFTREELSLLSKKGLKFQILLGDTGKTVTFRSISVVKTSVPVYNKSIDLGAYQNYWQFMNFPTAEQYMEQGQHIPDSGSIQNGKYALDSAAGTLSLWSGNVDGVFWYNAMLNSTRVDIGKNPVLKVNVPQAGKRWTIKVTDGSTEVNLFDEYSNRATGEIAVNLAPYYSRFVPASSPSDTVEVSVQFTVLETGGEDLPSVFQNLRIEYPAGSTGELLPVTSVDTADVTTDTHTAPKLPAFLTLTNGVTTADIHVTWTAPEQFDNTVVGDYVFTGTLSGEELANNGMTCDLPVMLTVHVVKAAPEFSTGFTLTDDYILGVPEQLTAAGFVEMLGMTNGTAEVAGDAAGTGVSVTVRNRYGETCWVKQIVVAGDVNGDGAVNAADISSAKKHVLTSVPLTGAYLAAADANGDSAVNVQDLIMIKRYLSGLGDLPYVRTVSAGAHNTAFYGRTYEENHATWFNWTASGFEVSFTGTELKAELLSSNPAIDDYKAYVTVFLDGETDAAKGQLIRLDRAKGIYTLASGLPYGAHTVKVLKRSENLYSTAAVTRYMVRGKLSKPVQKAERNIEFIGDSITCGFDNLASVWGAPFCTANEDGLQTYAAFTAKALQADFSAVSIAGWAIAGSPSGGLIPDIYDKTDGVHSAAQWDFASHQVDVVVVNLGTNDRAYCGTDAARLEEYRSKYTAFLKRLRGYYPDAQIVCVLGSMVDEGDPIRQMAAQAAELTGDPGVSWLELPAQDLADGGIGHPSVLTHQKDAARLARHIQSITGWQ